MRWPIFSLIPLFWSPAQIVILSLGLILASVSFADEAAETAARLETLKRQIEQVEQQIDRELGDRESLQRQLRDNDREIAAIGLRLKDLELRIDTLSDEASDLGLQRDQLQAQVNQAATALVQLIREQYRQGQRPRVQLLLSDQDPEKLDRMLRYYDQLSLGMKERVDRFNEMLAALDSTNLSLGQTEREIELERMQLMAEQRALETARLARVKTIARIDASIDQKRGSLTELNANVARLRQVLEEIDRSLDLASLESGSGAFERKRGALNWPIDGPVIELYGSERTRDGIVIGAVAGDTVVAVHPGRVVFSEWLRGYGLLIIVDHGQGYMTLYGQNQSLLRQTGDWVQANQAIAISGSSGGAEQSGVYFSIRHKAQSQNPQLWLSSSG